MRATRLLRLPSARTLLALTFFLPSTIAPAAELEVVGAHPRPRATDVPADTAITLRFDRPLARDSFRRPGSFWAFGRWSGTVTGALAFSDGDEVVTLTPARRLSAGESVTVFLARSVRGADGTPLRSAGYSYQFWVRAERAGFRFEEVQRFSTRSSSEARSRAYGGIATDLDGDGSLDLTIVNEDTADLRWFRNRGDGSGRFEEAPRIHAVGRRASPSEAGDFDLDGRADIAVANIDDGTIAILYGDGKGGFGAEEILDAGAGPRGVAVLDADGDGDMDVLNTASGPGVLAFHRNEGGRFPAPPSFFDAGAAGEWALGASDMNEDGALDLVVGGQASQEIVVLTGAGEGRFERASSAASLGDVWMLNVGDVDGDGHEDVVAVSRLAAAGAVLRGDGQGRLAPAERYPIDPVGLATDLGDLDGDSDLDWVTSSFGGAWLLFENQGAGLFSLRAPVPSPSAASCALAFDADNDGDLDLALIDEIADQVLVLRNGPVAR